MAPLGLIAAWSGDPLAGLVMFGSGAPLICAVVAALVGTMLFVLREKGGAGVLMMTWSSTRLPISSTTSPHELTGRRDRAARALLSALRKRAERA
jgi:hypothetical protein